MNKNILELEQEKSARLESMSRFVMRRNAVYRELLSQAETLLCKADTQSGFLSHEWKGQLKQWRDELHAEKK